MSDIHHDALAYIERFIVHELGLLEGKVKQTGKEEGELMKPIKCKRGPLKRVAPPN